MSCNRQAVIVTPSINEHQLFEDLKMQNLKNKIVQAKKALAAERLIDGEIFFDELLAGKFDK